MKSIKKIEKGMGKIITKGEANCRRFQHQNCDPYKGEQ